MESVTARSTGRTERDTDYGFCVVPEPSYFPGRWGPPQPLDAAALARWNDSGQKVELASRVLAATLDAHVSHRNLSRDRVSTRVFLSKDQNEQVAERCDALAQSLCECLPLFVETYQKSKPEARMKPIRELERYAAMCELLLEEASLRRGELILESVDSPSASEILSEPRALSPRDKANMYVQQAIAEHKAGPAAGRKGFE